jgi:hypothetical protein
MSRDEHAPLTPEELANEGVTALPDKEVVSILDLAADIDLAINGAAPVDLAVALNANVVAPIDAAVSANLLSNGSSAQALADQGVQVTQTVDADATALGIQDSSIDQSDTEAGTQATPSEAGTEQQALLAAGTTSGEAAETADAVAAGTEPVDGSVVVDAAGNVIGMFDSATGNVLAPDGTVIGTLNETTGLVVDAAGNIIGAVTDLVHGTEIVDAAGNVIGTLDGVTGNVVDAAGNLIGSLNPVTGQVLDTAGNLVGTVAQVLDDVTDTIDTGGLLEGNLLNVDVNVDLDADLAAPINGAVAANANVAAPIDAAVAANILSEDAQSTAIADQDAIITQSITGSAEATSDQTADINQADVDSPDTDTAGTDTADVDVAVPESDQPTTETPATDGTVAGTDNTP